MPAVELQRRLRLTSILAQLKQRRHRWFDHAARRPHDELLKDLPLPPSPRTWRRRTGGKLNTWETILKADLEPLTHFGYARWRKGWVKVSNELAQGCQAWGTSDRDVVSPIGDTGSTPPGEYRYKSK